MWRDYLFASSVGEALELLGRHQGQARLVAGGTDLVLQCQRGECPAQVLVDVTGIPGVQRIEEEDGFVTLGPCVTHAQAASSELLQRKGRLLADACRIIGGPQIRNVGTLAGNLVTALPAADAALALVALDGDAEVTSTEGQRWLPLSEFHTGVGLCRVDPGVEMITALRFRPLGPEYRSAHERLAQRKVHALPILNVGVIAAVREGRFADVRIAVAPVAPKPLRVRESEALLEGQEP
ncbi:MAG: FAD binding domain-containing protein, partial [Anaerolineae bacterium]|nr:FAD binding domain-containing protein [Anaerolineae bacterium]